MGGLGGEVGGRVGWVGGGGWPAPILFENQIYLDAAASRGPPLTRRAVEIHQIRMDFGIRIRQIQIRNPLSSKIQDNGFRLDFGFRIMDFENGFRISKSPNSKSKSIIRPDFDFELHPQKRYKVASRTMEARTGRR